MEILNYMAVFEVLTIITGLTTGICAALLPSPFDPRRPLAAIWCLSLSIGVFMGLLPIVADGARFSVTLTLSLVSVAIGFASTAAWRTEATTEAPRAQFSGRVFQAGR